MGLFQTSVLKKYRKLQDKKVVGKAYEKYLDYFYNPIRQENIRESKEEQFQEGFLPELFEKVFDNTLNPEPQFILITELKNGKGVKKAETKKTDEEIDQMVYELYGLTEDKIKTVEGAV